MSSGSRRSYAWILCAHALAAILLGVLESARLGSGRLALVIVPVFATTGLLVGAVAAATERLAARRATAIAALVVAAPSLIVTIPVFAKLFDGAYARTLPLATKLPVLAPLVAWLAIAATVAIGRRLASGDLAARAGAIIACALAFAAIAWCKKRVLGSGYPAAHTGATIALIALAGILFRVARRQRPGMYGAAALAATILGCGAAAAIGGLHQERDRRTLTTRGDQSRDLVRLWRSVLDFDRDGASALLGGGDCDDTDLPARSTSRLTASIKTATASTRCSPRRHRRHRRPSRWLRTGRAPASIRCSRARRT